MGPHRNSRLSSRALEDVDIRFNERRRRIRAVVGMCLATTLVAVTAPVLASDEPCEQRPSHARVTYTSPAEAEENATYGMFIMILRSDADSSTGVDSLAKRTHVKFVRGPNATVDLCVRVTPVEDAVVFIEAIHTSKATFDAGHFGALFVRSLGYAGPVDLGLHDSGIAARMFSGRDR